MSEQRYHEKMHPDGAITPTDQDPVRNFDQNILQLKNKTAASDLGLESETVLNDHHTLCEVLDGLADQISGIRRKVDIIKTTAQDSSMKNFTPGDLTPQQASQIMELMNAKKRERSVAFADALILVRHLVGMKTVNLEQACYIKEMQAKLQEHNIAVPSMQKPENTGSQASAEDDIVDEPEDESDFSDSDSDDDSDLSDDQDTSSKKRKPVEGNGLLEQIFNLQKKDHANALGLSLKEKKSKPLQPKSSGKNTLGQSQRPSMAKNTLRSSEGARPSQSGPRSTKSQKQDREQREMDQLYAVVQQAFNHQILDDGSNREAYENYAMAMARVSGV